MSDDTLYMFTNINNCKSCNNEVLNSLYFQSDFFDSLELKYELILNCRRYSDLKYYKKYFNLKDDLQIKMLNDSIINLLNPKSTSQYFVLTFDDSIVFESPSLNELIYFLKAE